MAETRKYGLFEKVDGKWVRLHPNLSFTKSTAVWIFQNALIEGALGYVPNERRLKPLKVLSTVESAMSSLGLTKGREGWE